MFDEKLSNANLGILITCIIFTSMMTYGLSKAPLLTMPTIGTMFLCCCSCLSSSGVLVNDVRKRI